MFKILYIGNIFSWDLCYEKNNSISIAANKWQENFLNNLEAEFEIKKISFIQSPVFPKGNQMYFPSRLQKQLNNSVSELIQYLNIPFLKKLSIFISLLKKLLRLRIWHYRKIVIYNIYSPVALCVVLLKKFFNYELVFLVLDMVPGEEFKQNKIRSFVNNLEYGIQKYLISRSDKLIVINELIIEDFKLFNKKSLILEGGVSQKDIIKYDEVKVENIVKTKKTLTYTGTLNDINGIEFLIKSFIRLEEKNYSLEIYGQGPLENKVKEYAEKYPKVKYCGFLENDRIVEVQKKSDLLIIPRESEKKVLRYTFPSKLFEYMLSGTPVLTTRLPGIPEEYKSHFYEVDVKNESQFAIEIDKHLSLSREKLKEKGAMAKEFIINNKKWQVQSQRVAEFLNDE